MSERVDTVATLSTAAWLALQQLAARGTKLVGALLGVVVAIVLMFTQLGFKGALYDSGVAVANSLDGQIILTSADFKTMSFNPPWLARGLLYEAETISGVRSASPLYGSTVQIANPANGNFLTTWLYAFSPDRPVFALPDVNEAIPLLRLPDKAIIDRNSRYELNGIAAQAVRSGHLDLVLPTPAAVTQFVFDIVGSFEIGPTISADGNIITSDLNFYRYLRIPLDRVSLGVVRLTGQADPVEVRDRLRKQFGTRAQVFLKADFIENETNFYAYHTPIGFIFNTGLGVGIFVGIVFITQVLHGMINDNLKEYAVLRAIGYGRLFFLTLIIVIAAIVALVAYAPSTVIVYLIYLVVGSITKLPLALKSSYLLAVLMLVSIMSLASALFSAKELRRADPVDLF